MKMNVTPNEASDWSNLRSEEEKKRVGQVCWCVELLREAPDSLDINNSSFYNDFPAPKINNYMAVEKNAKLFNISEINEVN